MQPQGFKPSNPRWENQDDYVVKEELSEMGVRLFVMLDGHGEVSPNPNPTPNPNPDPNATPTPWYPTPTVNPCLERWKATAKSFYSE